ncbi:hypothetical protein ACRALDRAFT_1092774 [Sodiomyces alcalophilus JCM 7366]|uniref:uncharacterized protein n=1 Tax=Sodiomyces alcalophilus JCM 7366 TaxID=591952 RepID=UPI0039B4729A
MRKPESLAHSYLVKEGIASFETTDDRLLYTLYAFVLLDTKLGQSTASSLRLRDARLLSTVSVVVLIMTRLGWHYQKLTITANKSTLYQAFQAFGPGSSSSQLFEWLTVTGEQKIPAGAKPRQLGFHNFHLQQATSTMFFTNTSLSLFSPYTLAFLFSLSIPLSRVPSLPSLIIAHLSLFSLFPIYKLGDFPVDTPTSASVVTPSVPRWVDEELAFLSEAEILRRALAPGSVIYTHSSYPSRVEYVIAQSGLQEIMEIGEGTQGTVFEMTGDNMVVKKEKPGNEQLWSNLYQEFTVHINVATAFLRYRDLNQYSVMIPQPAYYIPKHCDRFWDGLEDKFPEGHRSRSNAMVMERVLPLPKRIRTALAAHFHPPMANGNPVDPATVKRIVEDVPNKNCLVRPYLGRHAARRRTELRSLRNFSLTLPDMEALGMDVNDLAERLGKTFAIMHWGADADGNDVEFVLGTCLLPPASSDDGPTPSSAPASALEQAVQAREVNLVMLDFGRCNSISLQNQPATVVYQLYMAAMGSRTTGLYIPHPRHSPRLFSVFRRAYIETGQTILGERRLQYKFDAEVFMYRYEDYAVVCLE